MLDTCYEQRNKKLSTFQIFNMVRHLQRLVIATRCVDSVPSRAKETRSFRLLQRIGVEFLANRLVQHHHGPNSFHACNVARHSNTIADSVERFASKSHLIVVSHVM